MKYIPGVLSIANKIWFNDKSKCRLRICGFNDEQIKLLNKSNGLIDITIVDLHTDGSIVAKLHISDNIEDCHNEEWFEEYCHVCDKIKDKCHDDEMTTYDNPGFVCFECELARKAAKDKYKYADSLME